MATIVNDWVERAREVLGGGIVEQVNRLAVAYQPGDSSLTLQYDLKGITAGVPVTVGLNTFQVWSTEPASNLIEVSASWAGSPDVLAVIGDIVRVKPNFYTHRIVEAINDTLNELSTPLMGVHGVAVQDITYDPAVIVYDLSSCEEIDKVLRVQNGVAGDDTDPWADLDENSWQHRQTESTSDFPSGHQLRVFEPSTYRLNRSGIANTLRVVYSRRLAQVDTLDDDVTNTFLPETAYDLPVLGAASRLAVPQEFRRNLLNAQPDSRRANEVQPGASLGGARALRALYMERVEQESSRLMRAYPPKRR